MASLAPTFSPGDAEQLFRGALRERGLEPPRQLVADGQLHRCDAVGKPGRKDGSYLLHLDGVPSGGFQNWRDGAGWQAWCSRSEGRLSTLEMTEHRARVATARRAADLERTARAMEARATSERILAESEGCKSHPYLTKKGIGAHGLRVSRGSLVVPLRDVHGILHSLQFIRGDGRRAFWLAAECVVASSPSALWTPPRPFVWPRVSPRRRPCSSARATPRWRRSTVAICWRLRERSTTSSLTRESSSAPTTTSPTRRIPA